MFLSLSPPAIGRFDPRRGVRWPDVVPVLAVVALTAALIALVPRPLSSDVAGQLWIAHRLAEGARLYVDIAEVNPPLWFWLAIPVDWLAERLRTAPEGVLIAACGAAALASLLATGRLLAHVPAPKRSAFLVYAAAVLLVGPARDIGQRELFALFAALPYAALVAARREGRTVSWRLALLVGAGGAVGFALKHYFLCVPVLLELWLLATLRRGWRPFRAETLALAGAGLAYALAVLVVTPEYLTVTVPQLRFAYGTATAPPWRAMILPAQVIWLALLLAIVTQRRALRVSPLAVALLIAGAGFAAAWAIQHKGWPYHAIPATATLALALAALLAEAWERLGETARKLAVAVLVLPVALVAMPTHAPVTPENDIAPLLAGLKRGDAVALISTEGFTAWPAAVTGGYRWSGRYPQYWMLAAVDARGASDPRVARFGGEVVRNTALDYRCLPPLRIIVARPDPDGTASGDPLRYFLRDPQFAAVMAHYHLRKRHGIFDAYALTTPLVPTVKGCRHA